jgi:ribose/xylose/arabinose/galactoside ABC-type transport system permease subunit
LSLDADARQLFLLLGFLALIAVTLGSLDRAFLSGSNLLTILSLAGVLGLVSLGQLLALVSGGFDLSVSGVIPLGGMTYALLLNRGWPIALAMVAVLLVGALCGTVNGVLVTRFRINPLITTLGTLSITGGLALTLGNGLQVPFENIDGGVLAERGPLGVNNQVWLLLALAVLLHLVLRRTVYGRMVYAVGGNQEAARLAGIHVHRVIGSVYVLCSVFAALAGIVLASQLLTGSGNSGTAANLQSIAAVILGGASLSGGKGGVPGALIGVLIIGALANGLALLQVPSFYQTMATGAVLLLAVAASQTQLLSPKRR